MSSLFTSCKKEQPWWDADIVAPIAYSELSLGQIFADTLLATNPDSSLSIAYDSELFKFTFDSLIEIPDTTIFYNHPFPLFTPYLASPSDSFPAISNPPTTYNLNGVFLKRVLLRQGTIKVHLNSTASTAINYKISVPQASLNGVPLFLTINVPAPATSGDSTIVNQTYNVSGYDFNLAGPNGNKTNYLETYTGIVVAQSGYINPGEYVKAWITIEDMVPEFARGYFGNQTVNLGPDTAAFDVFNSIQPGILNLSSAWMNLTVTNEFGVDLRATFQNIKSSNSYSGNQVTLNGSPIAGPFNVTRATQTGITANPVQAFIKNLYLDQNNSNLVPFINVMPNNIQYSLNAQLNPLGNVSGYNDFAFYGTSLKARMQMEVPLNFSASDLGLSDTVDIDLSGVAQTENINSGYLTLLAENGYPMSLRLQGFILNNNLQVIDSLFSIPNTIAAPAIDGNGKVIQAIKSELKVPLTQEKIARLKEAKKIIFKAWFSTSPSTQNVKFYDHYKLLLKLKADINYSVNK